MAGAFVGRNRRQPITGKSIRPTQKVMDWTHEPKAWETIQWIGEEASNTTMKPRKTLEIQ